MSAANPNARPISDAQRTQLAAPLPRNVIRKLPGKTAADYVSGHYVITRLNTVFGHDGWQDAYEAPVVREGQRPSIYVQGTLTAAGVTRGDIGVGVAANESPDAFETAIKAAYTDCLKRCARKLGDSFGLALYEKERTGVGLSTTALSMLDELELLVGVDAVNSWAKANAAAVSKLDRDEQDIVKGTTAAARRRESTEPAAPPAAAPAAAPPAAAPTGGPSYLDWITKASSLDELVATYLATTLRGDRTPVELDEVKAATKARAAGLGVSLDELSAATAAARATSTDPAHWNAFATLLAMLSGARNAVEIAGVVRQHAAKAATLPDALKTKLNGARSERLKALATPAPKPTSEYDGLLSLITSARTEGELKIYHSRLSLLAATGAITERQAADATDALNARADALATAEAA